MMGVGRKLLAVTGVAAVLLIGGTGVMLLKDDPAGGAQVEAASVDLSPLDRVPQAAWDALAAKRIFFAHKSVGADVVSGLRAIMARKPNIGLSIADPSAPGPGFVECMNGENHDPASKIAAFEAAMDGGAGDGSDIALVKFCYVDVPGSLGAAELFESYRSSINGLKARHTDTTFVHVTLPVTRVGTGPKTRIKKLLGADIHGYAPNKARHEYNRLLRAEYADKEPVFDLAAAESTLPAGARAVFTDGGTFECLASAYTHDGGHLNEAGQLAAARDLLLVLAKTVQ